MSTHSRPQQQGAALAIALLVLVIITLLGVAAVRATQVELKLSQNAESRMAAIQAADSMAAFVGSNPENLPVNEDSYRACVRPSAVTNSTAQFTCATTDTQIVTTLATGPLRLYGYAEVQRQLPLFVEVNVMREAQLSAKNYDFARYTITGGYDRSTDGLSVAEITEGVLRLHTKIAGVNYE